MQLGKVARRLPIIKESISLRRSLVSPSPSGSLRSLCLKGRCTQCFRTGGGFPWCNSGFIALLRRMMELDDP